MFVRVCGRGVLRGGDAADDDWGVSVCVCECECAGTFVCMSLCLCAVFLRVHGRARFVRVSLCRAFVITVGMCGLLCGVRASSKHWFVCGLRRCMFLLVLRTLRHWDCLWCRGVLSVSVYGP